HRPATTPSNPRQPQLRLDKDPLADTLPRQLDEIITPQVNQLLEQRDSLGVLGRVASHLQPQVPPRVGRPLRQITVHESPDPVARTAIASQRPPTLLRKIMLAPSQRFDQDPVLTVKVIEDVTWRHPRTLGNVGHAQSVHPHLGDRRDRRLKRSPPLLICPYRRHASPSNLPMEPETHLERHTR